MEAGDRGTRQSGVPPASNSSRSHFEQPYREPSDRPYGGANMATAALISPAASSYHSAPHQRHHHPHHHHSSSSSSFSSGYPHAPPTSSVPGMISPADSRRMSDESEAAPRQSLPSIQEVISGSKQSHFAPAPPPTSLPSPFPTTPSRPFPEITAERDPSPRTMHPVSSFSRPEPLPAMSDSIRGPVSSRAPPPPPLNTHSPNSAYMKMDQHEAEQRRAEGPIINGGYAQQRPSAPALYPQSGQLPPGQLPLPSYPVSPRQPGPPLPSPFDSQRPSLLADDADFGRGSRGNNKYENAFNRHFEAWGYCEALAKIAAACRSIHNFAEAYDTAAREQHGQPIPSRLPTEQELNDMVNNATNVKKALEEVRDMVHQTRESERAREGSVRKIYEEDEVAMYRDGLKPSFGITEVKKRRGRAAPPGRCHSCNRIDTPEWRRGPDGARTLCNACGLHYAKLERKRQTEQRSIRPKPPMSATEKVTDDQTGRYKARRE